jgi:hypothetical protein
MNPDEFSSHEYFVQEQPAYLQPLAMTMAVLQMKRKRKMHETSSKDVQKQ